ncbi:GDSL-type esterase/lipase family protein [Ferrovibrio terrae]|uniref:GDSL-type esterase/lipase family protein n=1 Tax=Ferrovibrio terrae TaxID=2594003 RepID=UPI00163D671C|nr:GDSL-type esterase/lipase family protein [Ferrovibrio terrae]
MSAAPTIGIAEQAAALAARLGRATLPKNPIVVYGSSTVRLWPDVPASLGRQDVIPVGFGGATLQDCIEFYDLLVRPLAPRLLVVAAGTNDIEKRNAGPAEILALVETLIGKARRKQPALPVVVLTLKPAPFHGERMPAIRAANALLAEHLPACSAVTLIDIYAAFVNTTDQADPRFYAEDLRHLNDVGYAAWNRAIAAGLPPP